MTVAAPDPKANMGRPEPRIDGTLKVTGAALYASDVSVTNPAYAVLVTSAISKGRLTTFDVGSAQSIPGVLAIFTHETMPPIGPFAFFGAGGESGTKQPALAGPEIFHDGQIIGMVVAETYETAREAAFAIRATYDLAKPAPLLSSPGVEIVLASAVSPRYKDVLKGDLDEALKTSTVKIEAEYETASQVHNPIELFTTTCQWSGDRLTVYEPSQWVTGMKFGLARQIGIKPEQVHVVSPFVGGAFGSKGGLTHRTSLVARASRQLGRAVKLVTTREQGFTIATYRAETRHKVSLGATSEGKLLAYGHDAWEQTSRLDDYINGGTHASTAMYAAEAIKTTVYAVRTDRNTPGFMRAPAEVPYFFALESAMDELAVALKIDPVEVRRINDTMVNPANGAPYTSRSLMECYDVASKAFGWSARNPVPGSMRDGDWLIGWGCATATYPTQMAPATARVTLTASGTAKVQSGVHDVGTGAYTVLAQLVSEMLNVPMDKIAVELGDSNLPAGPVAGGSVTTASVGAAVAKACDAIKLKLYPNGSNTTDAAAAFKALGVGSIEDYAEYEPDVLPKGSAAALQIGQLGLAGGAMPDRTMFSFGAEFIEVRINARTREIRVPRCTGAFAAGRIVNPRTARSQLMGGMIWGISSALHEGMEIDERTGKYVNDNLAEYLVPVNADIGSVEIILVPEVDTKVNPLGIKGLGELGNVGTDAAVANAVYHATGKRIRKLPIRLEDLLDA
jgi:xanthine dehydrogenase YagR molybdenum-binding subunit